MASRQVTDEAGRVWECKSDKTEKMGQDVDLVCTTTSVAAPLHLKVSWRWAEIGEKGLARMIAAAVP
jgi:hypothetical protein